jgi:Cof subfamily protein (haloacid dehalogenase superfamily)
MHNVNAMQDKGLRLPAFDKIPGAVAIDLDGTLLNSQTQLSGRNRTAIEACIERSIPVIIATSRPARTTRRALGEGLSDECSLVIMNGALALGVPPLNGVFKEFLHPEIARRIIDLLTGSGPEVRVTIELEGWEFGTNWNINSEELWQRNAATQDMVMTLEEALARDPVKIATSRMGKDVSDLAEVVLQRFGDAVSVISSDRMTFLNILSARTSKSGALRKLLMTKGISLEDVLAFGDDVPDLDLLEACGMPVAMANCAPEIRAVTSYITASNDDDGVAIVLEKMLASTG